MRTVVSAFLVVLVGLALSGCCGSVCCSPCPCCPCPCPCGAPTASGGEMPAPAGPAAPASGGLLGDTSAFRENPERPGTWVWTKPHADLRAYDDLMIDDVVAQPRKGSPMASMSADDRGAAAKAFRDALLHAVGPYYDVVETPGPHTLRLRVALVDVPAKAGDASSVEAEMQDGKSGERLVAAIGSLGEAELAGGDATLAPAQRAANAWGARLLRYLDTHVR